LQHLLPEVNGMWQLSALIKVFSSLTDLARHLIHHLKESAMLQKCYNTQQGLQQLSSADFRTPARMVIGHEQQRTSDLTASPG